MATKKKSAPTKAEDAIALLSADHRKVEKLFKQYEKADGVAQKQALAAQICQELTVHTILEEEIFYPACRKAGVEVDDMDEAQVEHDSAKILIADLKAEAPREEFYDAKMTVLTEYIGHHVSEEERPRTGIFPQSRRGGVDLNALGDAIRSRKAQLLAEADTLRKPALKSLHPQNAA